MKAERRPLVRPASWARLTASARWLTLLACVAVLTAGCHDGPRQAMYDQAKYEPYEESPLFDDGGSVRMHPEGTVARGQYDADRVWATGTNEGGAYVTAFPERIVVDRTLLTRGEQRYGIFCAPCHGALGYGDGMIVQRGYTQPASYHEARLQGMPDGYFFDVISKGYGRMPAYAAQIPVDDRWAIVAYLRALQLSQSANLSALPGQVGEIARQAVEHRGGYGEAPVSMEGSAGEGGGVDDARAPVSLDPAQAADPDLDTGDGE